jgi:hypothetical protein
MYGEKRYEKPWPIAISLFIEKTTSVAFSGSPLWNVTPCLRVNVYVRPSVDTLQEVARSGCRPPVAVGKTRVSYRLTSAAQLASSDPFAGSEFGTLAKVRLSIWDDVVMLVLILLVEVVEEDDVVGVEVEDVVGVEEDVVVDEDEGAETVAA